jgi:hypothetical protein
MTVRNRSTELLSGVPFIATIIPPDRRFYSAGNWRECNRGFLGSVPPVPMVEPWETFMLKPDRRDFLKLSGMAGAVARANDPTIFDFTALHRE